MEQIGIGKDFLTRTQKAQHLRETMNKWDCIKLKSFCTESTGNSKTHPPKTQQPNEEMGT
jgi:hypothetical protein